MLESVRSYMHLLEYVFDELMYRISHPRKRQLHRAELCRIILSDSLCTPVGPSEDLHMERMGCQKPP